MDRNARSKEMSRHSAITIEEGSTNVYADLGYADADGMQRKSQLVAEIARAIKVRRLTQQEAAALLGIDQAKVSRIVRGQFRGVSEGKLLDLVTKLGHDVRSLSARCGVVRGGSSSSSRECAAAAPRRLQGPLRTPERSASAMRRSASSRNKKRWSTSDAAERRMAST